jgi:hypothetical protein
MKNIDKIPEGNPFKVPNNYFEEVNRKIISSTVENQYRLQLLKELQERREQRGNQRPGQQ